MIWMCFGVGFYFFTIFSLSIFLFDTWKQYKFNFLKNLLFTRKDILSRKMTFIDQFTKEAKVGKKLNKNIKEAIHYHDMKNLITHKEK